MKSVYIIMSPKGGIAINVFTGKGTVYADKQQADEALESINRHYAIKGYGICELVELEVKGDYEE